MDPNPVQYVLCGLVLFLLFVAPFILILTRREMVVEIKKKHKIRSRLVSQNGRRGEDGRTYRIVTDKGSTSISTSLFDQVSVGQRYRVKGWTIRNHLFLDSWDGEEVVPASDQHAKQASLEPPATALAQSSSTCDEGSSACDEESLEKPHWGYLVCPVGITLAFCYWSLPFLLFAERAEGIALAVEKQNRSEGGSSYKVTYRFTETDGTKQTGQAETGRRGIEPDDKVTVEYVPDWPNWHCLVAPVPSRTGSPWARYGLAVFAAIAWYRFWPALPIKAFFARRVAAADR